MRRLIVFLAVLLSVVVLISTTSCAKTQEEVPQPEPIEPAESSLPPEFFLDSDGDGFNDWFEENIAHYDLDIPNDRYIILYDRFYNEPNEEWTKVVLNPDYEFFVEKAEVPTENIIRLYYQEANAENLKIAIGKIAKKSDENDIVFLSLNSHGSSDGITGGVRYIMLDEWLDGIKAKAVVVVIMACGCEAALLVLKDGPCPRIIFVHSAGEFIGGLGADDEYFTTADTKYGNGDGYVSVGEIGNWIDNDPKWGPDWGELHEEGRSHLETNGYSKMSDTSNIALRTYLTDYTCDIALATSNP